MSKHTPGPWVVGPVDDTVVTHLGADGVRYEVAQIDGDYNEPDLWPVMEANARLIAAAPDLLDALQNLLDEAEDVFVCMADATGNDRHNYPSAFKAARAALAKAENG